MGPRFFFAADLEFFENAKKILAIPVSGVATFWPGLVDSCP